MEQLGNFLFILIWFLLIATILLGNVHGHDQKDQFKLVEIAWERIEKKPLVEESGEQCIWYHERLGYPDRILVVDDKGRDIKIFYHRTERPSCNNGWKLREYITVFFTGTQRQTTFEVFDGSIPGPHSHVRHSAQCLLGRVRGTLGYS